MSKIRLLALVLLGLLLWWLAGHGLAAARGQVMAQDFAYRGVTLGSTEAQAIQILGEPLYDKAVRRQGIAVKVLTYQDGVDVAVALRSGQVVDITVDLAKQRQFVLRDNVRYGATSAWLQSVYGKQQRQWLEGEVYYIYTLPAKPYARLLLVLDKNDYHLTALRITSLPLTEAELDARAEQGDDELEVMTDATLGDKQIDTSALPQTGEVKLGGYLP